MQFKKNANEQHAASSASSQSPITVHESGGTTPNNFSQSTLVANLPKLNPELAKVYLKINDMFSHTVEQLDISNSFQETLKKLAQISLNIGISEKLTPEEYQDLLNLVREDKPVLSRFANLSLDMHNIFQNNPVHGIEAIHDHIIKEYASLP